MNKQELVRWVKDRRTVLDASNNPFGCADWLLLFLEQIAKDEWQYFVDESSGIICYQYKPGRMKALGNYYTCLFEMESVPQKLPDFATLDLAPLESGLADAIIASMDGWYVRRRVASANHYMPCDGLGFLKYMEGRASKTKNTLKRKKKKFIGDGGKIEIITNDADGRAIDAYAHVYAKSWKKPEPYPEFVNDWIRTCDFNGWLRMGVAWLGDAPIATQFWFVRNRHAYVYKLAYDEEHKAYSAGTILTEALMEHVLDVDKVIEVDYLSGDDGYKKEWMTHCRERVGLMCCNLHAPRGLLAAAFEFVGEITHEYRQRWHQQFVMKSMVISRSTRQL